MISIKQRTVSVSFHKQDHRKQSKHHRKQNKQDHHKHKQDKHVRALSKTKAEGVYNAKHMLLFLWYVSAEHNSFI